MFGPLLGSRENARRRRRRSGFDVERSGCVVGVVSSLKLSRVRASHGTVADGCRHDTAKAPEKSVQSVCALETSVRVRSQIACACGPVSC